MVDRDQTRGFPEWCEHLARAFSGDKDLQRQTLENGREADAHLKRMRDDQHNYAENLEAMSKMPSTKVFAVFFPSRAWCRV
jgi:hypothetical protein